MNSAHEENRWLVKLKVDTDRYDQFKAELAESLDEEFTIEENIHQEVFISGDSHLCFDNGEDLIELLKEYALDGFKAKTVYIDETGDFGGTYVEYNHDGQLIQAIALNELFD